MPFAIRNILIRIIAVLEQVWNFFSARFRQIGAFLGNRLGFANTGYFLDAEESSRQSITTEKTLEKKTLETETTPSNSVQSGSRSSSRSASRSSRQSTGSDQDYFRNMARQIKKPSH